MNTYVRTNLSSIDSGYGCRVSETTSQNITQNTWTALSVTASTWTPLVFYKGYGQTEFRVKQ
jgi:hypothetical protein